MLCTTADGLTTLKISSQIRPHSSFVVKNKNEKQSNFLVRSDEKVPQNLKKFATILFHASSWLTGAKEWKNSNAIQWHHKFQCNRPLRIITSSSLALDEPAHLVNSRFFYVNSKEEKTFHWKDNESGCAASFGRRKVFSTDQKNAMSSFFRKFLFK